MKFIDSLSSFLDCEVPQSEDYISNEQLIRCIDLTLLEEHTSIDALTALSDRAQKNRVAALCVYLNDLVHIKPIDSLSFATVINFPQGNQSQSDCFASIRLAMEYHVQEIDYVFP